MRSQNILVVDDDKIVRETLEDILKEKGYSINTADNAISAMTKLEQNNYDLIYCDYGMPGMNGLEFFNKIKKINIPFVLISGEYKGSRKEVLRLGAKAYIKKPFNPFEIINITERINFLEKERFIEKAEKELKENLEKEDAINHFKNQIKKYQLIAYVSQSKNKIEKAEEIASLGYDVAIIDDYDNLFAKMISEQVSAVIVDESMSHHYENIETRIRGKHIASPYFFTSLRFANEKSNLNKIVDLAISERLNKIELYRTKGKPINISISGGGYSGKTHTLFVYSLLNPASKRIPRSKTRDIRKGEILNDDTIPVSGEEFWHQKNMIYWWHRESYFVGLNIESLIGAYETGKDGAFIIAETKQVAELKRRIEEYNNNSNNKTKIPELKSIFISVDPADIAKISELNNEFKIRSQNFQKEYEEYQKMANQFDLEIRNKSISRKEIYDPNKLYNPSPEVVKEIEKRVGLIMNLALVNRFKILKQF